MSIKNDEERLGISSMIIDFSPHLNKKNFYFLFGNTLSALKLKMISETNIRQGIEGRYSILYKEYKITYFVCSEHDIIMIIGWHKLSSEEYVFMKFR